MHENSLFGDERRGGFNLYDDWVFRYLYSKDDEDSRQALMAVLNVVLHREDDPIVGIKIKNPFFPRDNEDGKESVLDILARTNSGEIIDIEMQNRVFTHYVNRTLLYGSRMVNSALEKGQEYDMMEKSIVISFVNGIQFPESHQIHTCFYLLEKREYFLMTDRLEFHYIELGKINGEKPVEELTPVEKLAAYILYAGDKTKEDYVQKLINTGGDAVAMTEKIFSKLTDDEMAWAYKFSMDKAEHDRIVYEKQRMRESLEEGRARGLEEGLEKGRAKGLEEGLKEGRAKGLEEGLKEGRAKGLKEGLEEGRMEATKAAIKIFIEDKLEDGKSREEILEKLQRRFGLTQEQATQYLDEC